MPLPRQRPFDPDRGEATPRRVFLSRRRLLAGAASLSLAAGLRRLAPAQDAEPPAPAKLYPAPRNEKWKASGSITDQWTAAHYNNFYEFGESKTDPARNVGSFVTDPWSVEVKGLVSRKETYDLDRLQRLFPLEERLYRFRCVEAWAMVIPWTGFPLSLLLERAGPTEKATHVRFLSFLRPEQAIGQRTLPYPWPYYEGLTLAEAMHPLTLVVTGVYGHPLPGQHGAPVRIIVPWKYGYKSAKSVVTIEVVGARPRTFWNDQQPDEYSFLSNVDPAVPHPRWSQATERMLGSGERVETQPFNGYAEHVAHLYR